MKITQRSASWYGPSDIKRLMGCVFQNRTVDILEECGPANLER